MTRTRAAAAPGSPVPFHDDPGDSRGLAALVSAAAQPAPTHPDAGLLALDHQWAAHERRWATYEAAAGHLTREQDDERYQALCDAGNALVSAIAVQPARTFTGLAIKARILAQGSGETLEDDGLLNSGDDGILAWAAKSVASGDDVGRMTGSLVADLLRLAQEAGR